MTAILWERDNRMVARLDGSYLVECEISPCCLGCGGLPEDLGQYGLTLAGIVNGTCEDCENLNGVFLLDPDIVAFRTPPHCLWRTELASICGASQAVSAELEFVHEGGVRKLRLTLGSADMTVVFEAEVAGFPDCGQEIGLALTGAQGNQCDWSEATCTLSYLGP